MSFAQAHTLLSALAEEVSGLLAIKQGLEVEMVRKSEALARLEAAKQAQERTKTRPALPPFPLAGLPTLRPTTSKVSAPAFPDIESESSQASEIMPHLFLGGNLVARDYDKISSKGITRVLNVASGVCPNYFPDKLKYTSLELIDAPHEEIDHFILHAIAEIESCLDAGEKILVHCHQGISRSATLVIAYVAWKLDLSIVDALYYVKARRSIVSPNQGFLNQLAAFEARRSAQLHDREPFSVYHLTQHSQHVSTLVLKRVLAGRVLEDYAQDVFIAIEGNAMRIRTPANEQQQQTQQQVQTAHKLATWMARFDHAYRNASISIVPFDDAEFARIAIKLPLTTTTTATSALVEQREVIQHILSNQ